MTITANFLAAAILCLALVSCSPYGRLESQVTSKSMSRIGPGEYLVIGTVVSPGMHPVDSTKGLHVSQAIQRAGGFAQFANKKYIILRRGRGMYMQRIYIDLDRKSSDKPSKFGRVFRSDDPHFDPFIRAGDVIIVEERLLTW